jgi:hypothetical protein
VTVTDAAGASATQTYPFHVAELAQRTRRARRSTSPTADDRVIGGTLPHRRPAHRHAAGGRPIRIRPRERHALERGFTRCSCSPTQAVEASVTGTMSLTSPIIIYAPDLGWMRSVRRTAPTRRAAPPSRGR